MKEGVPKKEIFQCAIEEGLDRKKVAKYLAMYPDLNLSIRYERANNILLTIYMLIVAIGVYGAFGLLAQLPTNAFIIGLVIGLLIPGCIIYLIYTNHALGYLFLAFFSFKGIFDSFKEYDDSTVGVIAVSFGVIVSALLTIYSVVLKRKLFPHQNFLNFKKDDEGLFVFTKD